ncbi:MAG TPA: family 1 glycosylhydrolase [Elusimicrobiota bacterium]|jgi:beta-glucosidase/6-phospho-beta-glucosidase/beta-galactosidase|nr:family 1 glycosylhydrolase [Elusimicrobiota bacterium]
MIAAFLLLLAAVPVRAQARFDPPFFFGLASAPAQSEDGLRDIWLDWARAGKTAAFRNQVRPEDRLEFWSHPEVELDLAARTGVGVYRLGVDWGRVEPAPHVFDEAAIRRYRDILGMVRARHMRVMLTLMHHSVPKWAQEEGGWLNDGMEDDYLEFARRMIDEYHSDVDYWITFNEGNVFAPLAYTAGLWPPGGRRSAASLLAFGPFRGATVEAMDRMGDAHDDLDDWAHAKYPGIKLGLAQNMAYYTSDGLVGGLVAHLTSDLMNWRLPERVRGRMDFFGMNYYGAEWIDGTRLILKPGVEYSESGRAIYPEGLYLLLKEIHRRFPGPPIIITENGISDSTDILRPSYLIEHLQAVAQARADGVPVAGYIYWTLSDNWEWTDGYCPKFGLAAVDRAHGLRRLPRPSYALFRAIVTTREITPAMRRAAGEEVDAHVGQERPFCRAADAFTALDAPVQRPILARNWRFR